jgi:hypothetical protein
MSFTPSTLAAITFALEGTRLEARLPVHPAVDRALPLQHGHGPRAFGRVAALDDQIEDQSESAAGEGR